ncbi:MAG: hypothetical protein ABIG84_01955 [archaeon]
MKHKLKEWIKRYLPAEIAGMISALTGAGVAYMLTDNLIVVALAGVWSETIGYYAFISIRDIAHSRKHHRINNKKYGLISFLKNIRNLIIEFGFSETLDSFFIRPFFMYVFPIILGNVLLGVFIGKISADVVFYIPTITAYELRKKHLGD